MLDSKEDISESIYTLGKSLSLGFIALAILSFLILLAPFFLPNVFDYSKLGTLGDAVGGFLNPLIGIAAALLTFLAFFIQYKANQFQRTSIEMQKKDLELERFENNFFEMVRLHKENINEMKITGYELDFTQSITSDFNDNKETFNRRKVSKITDGRKVFVTMVTELTACFQICNYFLKKYDQEEKNRIAFRLWFFGINSEVIDDIKTEKKLMECFQFIRKKHRNSFGEINTFRLINDNFWAESDMPEVKGEKVKLYIKYKPFSGHESRLGHFYRHLFSSVNFVVTTETRGILDYNQSRHYLKILRSQLSNDEQLMLYYNYIVGFGSEWDQLGERGNQFLTKYRMLHNVPVNKIRLVESPRIHFKEYIDKNLDTLIKDPLFEWGDK